MRPNRRSRALPSAVVRTVIGAVGRFLVTVGLLILLFVAYQLWGTGIYEARAQSDLKSKFHREISNATTPTTAAATTTTGAAPPTTVPVAPAGPGAPTVPPDGDPVGEIMIPKIGVDKIVVEGTTVPDLRMGPGHYAGSPLPGQLGNVAIAGHRTTYGAPFGDLDQLARGDSIQIRTTYGTWFYVVDAVPRKGGGFWPDHPFAVSPDAVEVLEPSVDPTTGQQLATLTLTTCNPKYQASQRLIVKARLTQPPLPAPVVRPKLVAGLSGGTESRIPALITGLIAAAVGGLWWLIFHRYPRWTTWLAGVLPFLVTLFVFYFFLERLLPNNY
jgi:sortase A